MRRCSLQCYPGAKVLYEEAASKLWKMVSRGALPGNLSVAWVLWVFEMSLLGTWTVRTVAPHMLHLKNQNCWPESVFPHHRLPTKPTGCGITHVMLHLYHMLTLAKPGPIAKPQVVYKSKHSAWCKLTSLTRLRRTITRLGTTTLTRLTGSCNSCRQDKVNLYIRNIYVCVYNIYTYYIYIYYTNNII